MRTTSNFIAEQRRAHALFFAGAVPGEALHLSSPYRLGELHRAFNLHLQIRELAAAYFGPPRNIAWHMHASHGLSSQVCCLNFLMPLARRPEILAQVIGPALGLSGVTMLPVEDDLFVGFEWTGQADYLDEWGGGTPTRGANVTSADAIVRFEHGGKRQTVLIEWKYTESYGAPPAERSRAKRLSRYRHRAFAPDGPLRADLGLAVEDLLWEPVYQMFRQQMLAFAMERAREDGADRVSVLHLSPAGNLALHRVTAPALQARGDDVFEVFRSLLVRPADFVSASIEGVFGPALVRHAGEDWAAYLTARYPFIRSL